MVEKVDVLDAKEIIGNELAIHDVNEAWITKRREEYMPLVITDLKDEKQLEAVHKARMEVKKGRVLIQNVSKKTRTRAVQFQKDCIAEENRLIGLIEPIEVHLQTEEDKVERERVRIKAEAEAKEAARIQVRIDRICDFGAIFNGQMYTAYGISIPVALVKVCNDEQFEQFIAQIQEKKDGADALRKAELERQAAEQLRLEKIAAEQEAERVRLEEIARKQAEESAKLKAEQEAAERKIREAQEAIEKEKKRIADEETARLKAILDEKKRVEDERRRTEEIEKAKAEAAEHAKKQAEEKAAWEAKEKAEREAVEKAEAEKQESLKPDKEKILKFCAELELIKFPEVGENASHIIESAKKAMGLFIKSVRKMTGEL